MKLSRVIPSLILASSFISSAGFCATQTKSTMVPIKDGLLVRSFIVDSDNINGLVKSNGMVDDPVAIEAIKQKGTQPIQDETYNFGTHYIPMRELKAGAYTFRRKPVMFATWQDLQVAIGITHQNGKTLFVPEERKYNYDYRITSPKTSIGALHVDLTVSTTSPGSGWFNTETRTRRVFNVPVTLGTPHDKWFIIPQKSNSDGTHRVLLMGVEPLSNVDLSLLQKK